jgi:glycosyltransferase involved in cell wall biosynthesis
MKESVRVSCILPTYKRREMLTRSINMFVNQTYSNKELIIIDDSPIVEHIFLELIDKLNKTYKNTIKYIRINKRMSIGRKRNVAIEVAKGTYIAFWDDDDIHGPNRLRNQVNRMQQTSSDVTTNGKHMYYDMNKKIMYNLQKFPNIQEQLWWMRMLMPSVIFKKNLWNKYATFPDISKSEDREFFIRVLKKKPNLRIDLWEDAPIDDFVYIIHKKNTAWSDLASQMISVTNPYLRHCL